MSREHSTSGHEYVLELEDVRKSYGSKIVLADIDLKVRRGEFCTVVGPSGCGKSTLLRLILGQEEATYGTFKVFGAPVRFADATRGIVYQKYGLLPNLTVFQNVMLGKKFSGSMLDRWRHRKTYADEVAYYLDRVCLSPDDYNKYPEDLSGGMQQRVAVAQALIKRAPMLLMDEPFGALDPGIRESMQVFILEVWEEYDLTIFFVTHDLPEAVFLGTRILGISQYYEDGGSNPVCGARIVCDHALPRSAQSTVVKETAAFGQLVQEIRYETFTPEHRQYVTEFNLKHPDSFQTLTNEERNGRQ